MGAGPLVVTYPLTGRSRAIVEEELGGTAEAVYLVDLAPAARAHALGRAGAVLSHDTSKELRPDEIPLIRNARLLQFTAAGVDWVRTRDLPPELPVAANKGGGAEPMSEHIVALALAAAKGLFIDNANLKSGEFKRPERREPGSVRHRRASRSRSPPSRLSRLLHADHVVYGFCVEAVRVSRTAGRRPFRRDLQGRFPITTPLLRQSHRPRSGLKFDRRKKAYIT
jgi:hypothetical protein